jgi:hypothetical protein
MQGRVESAPTFGSGLIKTSIRQEHQQTENLHTHVFVEEEESTKMFSTSHSCCMSISSVVFVDDSRQKKKNYLFVQTQTPISSAIIFQKPIFGAFFQQLTRKPRKYYFSWKIDSICGE